MNASHTSVLVCALSLAVASPAQAWGSIGHRITGTIAQQLLTPAASEQVKALIPDADFAQLSTWMDEHKLELKRRLPGSDQWHYQDEPACDGLAEAVCPDGNCAGHQIGVYRKVLADQNASRAARAEALTFLIHLVGDIHQPLHTADNHDRGGNEVKVRQEKRGHYAASLHALWDTELVELVVGDAAIGSWSADAMAAFDSHFSEWRAGDVADWIAASNQLARNDVYQPLPEFACGQLPREAEKISISYLENGQQIVREELVKAGVRIAEVVNEALK